MSDNRAIAILLALALIVAPVMSGVHVVSAHDSGAPHGHAGQNHAHQHAHSLHDHAPTPLGHQHGHGGHDHHGVGHGHDHNGHAAHTADAEHEAEYCKLIHLHAGSAAVVATSTGIESSPPASESRASISSTQKPRALSLAPIARGPPSLS